MNSIPLHIDTQEPISLQLDGENDISLNMSNIVVGDDPSKFRAFDTVAEMQIATNLYEGVYCHTNGFHSSGDGGAAWYKISETGTANGMDVLSCGDLSASLVIMNGFATPEMFGAYGDGIHDDAGTVQYCVDFCGANNVEMRISNTYLLNSTVYVHRALNISGVCSTGVEQIAAGKWQAKARFIVNFAGVGIYIVKSGAYGQVFEGGGFHDFGINPSDDYISNSDCVGIRIEAWSHFTFDNVAISRFNNGIGISLQNGGQYCDILNCKFENNLVAISEQPKESDTSKFFGGCLVDGCYFDSNGNGTLFNHNPRANSIGIDLYDGANWSIVNNRFQGIETCIKGGTGYYITMLDNRFEMFAYGIKIYGAHNIIGPGNRFDGYLGTSGRTKIAVEIEQSATYTQVYSIGSTSLEYIPIRNYGSNTRYLCYEHIKIYIPELSESRFIPLGTAPYRGIVQNAVLTTGRIASSDPDGFGNSDSSYWNILFGSQKPPAGLSYFKTTGKNWGKASRYGKLRVIDAINDPNDVSSVIQAGNTITLYIGKVGSPETVKDVTVECDFVFWY